MSFWGKVAAKGGSLGTGTWLPGHITACYEQQYYEDEASYGTETYVEVYVVFVLLSI